MLNITRKPNESIIINDNIKITYTELKGRQIKLSIEAPREIPIYREELYLRIAAEKAAEPDKDKH